MAGRTWIQEPCARFFRHKQNFWFDLVFNGQYVGVFRYYFGFADEVDLLLSSTLVINSLSLFVSSFNGTTVALNVPGLLAVIAGSIVLGHALASVTRRQSGRASSLVVRSVGRTLYYIRIVCRVFCKLFSSSFFGQDCARDFGVLYGGCKESCIDSVQRKR